MLLTSGERISNALVAMAIHSLGAAGAIVHRFAGRGHHHRHPRQRQDHRRHAGPAAGRARRGAASCWSPASRASARTARTSPRWAAADRTPPPSRWPRRWTPTCARSTPTSTASSPPTPRIVPNARHLDTVTFEEMLEMAACGAKVLMLRCVEYARRYDVPIHVRSSYSDKPGTIVSRIDRGHTHGRRHPDRSRARPQRGEGDRRRPARHSRLRRQGVSRRRRRRRQHRHGVAEHLQGRGRQDRHHVHLLARQRAQARWRSWTRCRTRSASPRCSTTTTSARCR